MNKKQSLFHIAKRDALPWYKSFAIRGFTAVMVSWMAKFNPIIMVFTSLLLVVLGRGASEISSTFGLNQSFSDILTGIILFFIIGSEFFITYQVSLRKSGKKEA